MDYHGVPTTVFTPFEYGACGLNEDDARKKYGMFTGSPMIFV
jgi:thioredoxin reductase (NADPH)